MDNANPDFQMKYHDGTKVELIGTLLSISMPDGARMELSDCRPETLDRISPPTVRLLVGECLARYKQCCQVAECIRPNRDQLPFPYLITETGAKESIDYPSLPTLVSATMSTLRQRTWQPPSTKRETFLRPNSYSPGDPLQGNESMLSLAFTYRTFLPDVGWCLASPEEQFLLLFADGMTVLIDGARNMMAYHDKRQTGSKSVWLRIDDNSQSMPNRLREKLAHFPKFVSLLKSGQGHSFVQ